MNLKSLVNLTTVLLNPTRNYVLNQIELIHKKQHELIGIASFRYKGKVYVKDEHENIPLLDTSLRSNFKDYLINMSKYGTTRSILLAYLKSNKVCHLFDAFPIIPKQAHYLIERQYGVSLNIEPENIPKEIEDIFQQQALLEIL